MFLKKTRICFGHFLLRQKFRRLKRKKQFFNINTASHAAVFFRLSEDTLEQYDDILSLLSFFREHEVKLFTCCYYEGKTIPLKLMQNKKINFFSERDVDFFIFPKAPYKEYINQEFDILVDLSLAPKLPLDYLITLSKAKCKVGNMSCGKEKYDILIDTSKNDDNFVFYLEQIKHFLSSIK